MVCGVYFMVRIIWCIWKIFESEIKFCKFVGKVCFLSMLVVKKYGGVLCFIKKSESISFKWGKVILENDLGYMFYKLWC